MHIDCGEMLLHSLKAFHLCYIHSSRCLHYLFKIINIELKLFKIEGANCISKRCNTRGVFLFQ